MLHRRPAHLRLFRSWRLSAHRLLFPLTQFTLHIAIRNCARPRPTAFEGAYVLSVFVCFSSSVPTMDPLLVVVGACVLGLVVLLILATLHAVMSSGNRGSKDPPAKYCGRLDPLVSSSVSPLVPTPDQPTLESDEENKGKESFPGLKSLCF